MLLTRLAIIGNGMVGHHLIQTMADQGIIDQYAITLFCEEPTLAYDRVNLTKYLSGSSADDLSLGKMTDYEAWGLDVKLGVTVNNIDLASRCVTASDDSQTVYDKLVLATGSYPFVPPVPGHDNDACFVYRTLADLDAIEAAAKTAQSGVVVGGGLLGLEAAKALVDLGLTTHVVEFSDRLMMQQLDAEGGALLRHKITQLGVQIHTEKNTQRIDLQDDGSLNMIFADGQQLATDLLVFSAGIRPRDQLAGNAGIELGERGGITINDQCLTSDPNVYAIGECALWQGRIFGLVAPGYQMAKAAVAHLQNSSQPFTGADMSTKLKLMGVDVASIGDAQGTSTGAKSYRLIDERSGSYQKLVVNAAGNKLLGAILVGDASLYGELLQYCLNGLELPEQPEMLLFPNTGEASALSKPTLPDSATICACHNVCKGDLNRAVEMGHVNVADVKAHTKAATGCGGCGPMVADIVQAAVLAQGGEVNDDLCEHFAYSRQALYDLVRIKQLQTFDEVLAQYGSGIGCEICKPALASILASCWNQFVLSQNQLAQQDTNDRFLANIQKNGTYSVVPRVAAGEIKPAQLIVLGEVAQEFNLYCKITGGQRIDLLGARQEQLPAIWQRLIDAGFETGQAYGKSVRTVKSCVGDNWCRYGTGDSMGLAIAIEHRYKGLRSPHKLKFAVSGCIRECAEARSKDIGVIATDKGWNLYVCGNGGIQPRHADLFATDLDEQSLIKYVDRLLMFYIKTADRLQRTSTWLGQLDGGLDYLKRVVIDDYLGLAEQLEVQMQDLVDGYQCEWKATLEDPQARARFKPFVNSDATDASIQMHSVRGQTSPVPSVPPLAAPAPRDRHQLINLEQIS